MIETILGSLASPLHEKYVDEAGIEGTPPRRVAYLRLAPRGDASDYAEITVTGGGAVFLRVPGGFAYLDIVELDDEQGLREELERFVEIATAYLAGARSTARSRFGVPYLQVDTDHGHAKLELSVRNAFRHIFGRSPQ